MINREGLFKEYNEEFIEKWSTSFCRASIAIKQLLKEYDELSKVTITAKEIQERASNTWDNIRDDPPYKAQENIEDAMRYMLTDLGVEIIEEKDSLIK